ncbi:MAG: hypothetical protein J6D28_06265 [Bacilli bacterium]|nr:hypothetical protein [Bacilli bacterium]
MNIPFFYLVKNNDNSEKKKEKQKTLLNENNDKLVKLFNKIGINEFIFTSIGNSIATGYSMNDTIKPLILRNEDLVFKLNQANINFAPHSFALAQDNNDEHILDWIINNKKEADINYQAYLDFTHELGMNHKGITRKQAEEYYVGIIGKKYNSNVSNLQKFPSIIKNNGFNNTNKDIFLDSIYEIKRKDINFTKDLSKLKQNIGLRDLINTKKNGTDITESNLANIIVYNGATGSFIDNVKRMGKHKGLYGFYRDYISMEAVLKQIYLSCPTTQVYVCGIPNLMKINIVWFLNKKIKDMCLLYPNCTYVNPVSQNFLYKKNGELIADIHYNDEEYLKLNNNIIESICANYIPNMVLTKIDSELKKYSKRVKYNEPERRNTNINSVINTILGHYEDTLTKKDYQRILKYYQEKYSCDYFYTNKKETEKDLKRKIGG